MYRQLGTFNACSCFNHFVIFPQLWEVYGERRCLRTFIGNILKTLKYLGENIIFKQMSCFILKGVTKNTVCQ